MPRLLVSDSDAKLAMLLNQPQDSYWGNEMVPGCPLPSAQLRVAKWELDSATVSHLSLSDSMSPSVWGRDSATVSHLSLLDLMLPSVPGSLLQVVCPGL